MVRRKRMRAMKSNRIGRNPRYSHNSMDNNVNTHHCNFETYNKCSNTRGKVSARVDIPMELQQTIGAKHLEDPTKTKFEDVHL